jgi:ABC-type transporter Mla maintaining outer membrane lipid asymmetry ATPase subunit MlaF
MLHAGRILWRGPASMIDHSGDPAVEQFVAGRAEGPLTQPPAGSESSLPRRVRKGHRGRPPQRRG